MDSPVLQWFGALAATLLMLVLGSAAPAATFKTLYSFCVHSNCPDGAYPDTALVIDKTGNLYGSASEGTDPIFKIARRKAWKHRSLYKCTHHECGEPLVTSDLIIDVAGNLYGETQSAGGAGAGTVFKLSPPQGAPGTRHYWTATDLHTFCSRPDCSDGWEPEGGLTYAGAQTGAPYDGVSPLYGVTIYGGAHNNGTVFRLSNSGGVWSETVLYNFCSQANCTDGAWPDATPTLDGAGNLFGVTFEGGASNVGTIFELNSTGETVLYNFCPDGLLHCSTGFDPDSPLLLDADGSLIGAIWSGGAKTNGTIFKVVPNGAKSQFNVLYTFCEKGPCTDGSWPRGKMNLDASGNLFGATVGGGANGGGTVFRLNGSLKVLYSFCSLPDCADGNAPDAGVSLGGKGRLFGTTLQGGANGDGQLTSGTVFELDP